MKQRTPTRNINFRQTRSERSATRSYRDFGRYLKQKFKVLIDSKNR